MIEGDNNLIPHDAPSSSHPDVLLPDHVVAIKPEYLAQRGQKQQQQKEKEKEGKEPTDIHLGKKRPRPDGGKPAPGNRVCVATARGEVCQFGEKCRYQHDLKQFLLSKPPDLDGNCHQYQTFGFCANGLMCRFGSSHIDADQCLNMSRPDEQGGVLERTAINVLDKGVQSRLRKRQYDFNSAYIFDKEVKLVDFRNKVYVAPLTTVGNLPFRRILKDYGADITCGEMAMTTNLITGQASEWALLRKHSSEDKFGIQLAGNNTQLMEKVCKLLERETVSDFIDLNCGCPIDLLCDKGCGAALMNTKKRLLDVVSAMCTSLPSRSVTVKIRTGWSESDPSAHLLVPEIQKLSWTKQAKVAAIFVHGRSRLQRYHRLANWNYIAQVARSQNPALPLVPIIGNGDIFSFSDWESHCALLERDLESLVAADEQQQQQQQQQDQLDVREAMGLASCAMIGRGALIKPWLPTEIKERRYLDISASERLDMLKRFCNYGMEHWGSDQQGINTTRRFLLEWLSFLHRYVPVALLEHSRGPQRINQRPPHYFGRCDLETLLASNNSQDWVRISEMLLGKVDEDFVFVAKHKTNSYAPPEQQVRGAQDARDGPAEAAVEAEDTLPEG